MWQNAVLWLVPHSTVRGKNEVTTTYQTPSLSCGTGCGHARLHISKPSQSQCCGSAPDLNYILARSLREKHINFVRGMDNLTIMQCRSTDTVISSAVGRGKFKKSGWKDSRRLQVCALIGHVTSGATCSAYSRTLHPTCQIRFKYAESISNAKFNWSNRVMLHVSD